MHMASYRDLVYTLQSLGTDIQYGANPYTSISERTLKLISVN